ncbi:hypothetical protein SISSUDRAFT_1054465 [Sistotremastrum suecicum HHB10207 ss-3]|uniref:Exocyst complex component Sec3 PIP2-binding N-terminal domain-containing protein n=1 Tax=Sistotremastrum suecicum HHB10207 ss-3 TaxID=1314776 RepID=A0A165YHL1_9AGAM|nr:hypothetical protein SISSUDRAFT_1054465 [Sistotremastrum suecicum HHB10207 ss-3]
MTELMDIRQRINASLFSREASRGVPNGTYLSHVKIWEDDEQGGRKPRFIVLAQDGEGRGKIYKTKINTGGSFSIGKSWDLDGLRGVEVLSPAAFNITLNRTYRWDTENSKEQVHFVNTLIRTFRDLTRGAPLNVVGNIVEEPRLPAASPRSPAQNGSTIPGRGIGHSRTSSQASSTGTAMPSSPSTPSRRPLISPAPVPAQPSPRAPPTPSTAQSSYRPASPAEFGPIGARMNMTSPSPTPTSATGSPTLRARAANRPPPSSGLRNSESSSTLPSVVTSVSSPRSAAPSSRFEDAYDTRSPQDTVRDEPPSRPSLDVPRSGSPAPRNGRKSPRTRTPSPSASGASQPSSVKRSSPLQTPRAQTRPPSPEYVPKPAEPIKKDANARVSFFDPANSASADRLLSRNGSFPDNEFGFDGDGTAATLADVEDMLDGYEWTEMNYTRGRSAADQIEAMLHDELMALEKANIHSFIESDDRILHVLKYVDDALKDLDSMDQMVQSYKIHLNAVGDDISHIQSQNRGLQVQTQNQRALLGELNRLLETVDVDRNALMALKMEKLDIPEGIARLESAAAELYKALQASRDTDMAATMERLQEYRTHNTQFCQRLFDFLKIMFSVQADRVLNEKIGSKSTISLAQSLTLARHEIMEAYLGQYSGLMLYLKDMDEERYGKVCAVYFSTISELHSKQIKAMLMAYVSLIKKASDDEVSQNFSVATSSGIKPSAIRRAGTIVRSPLESRKDKDKDKVGDGELRGYEALGKVLEQIAPQIYHEEDFIADFLQINDAGLTFADYANLENYYRRQAARAAGLSATTSKLIRGAMDLIFGFLPNELKQWIDGALRRDSIQIVGMLACIERFVIDAEERGNNFLLRVLEKQHTRLKSLYDRHVDEQIKAVEDTKLTTKKRKGVAHFIKYFPIYVHRVEDQLIGSNSLEVRTSVDAAYEKIIHAMFEALQQMAKMDGEGEDKGQLNFHVILIENMHFFLTESDVQELVSMVPFNKRAQRTYEENLDAYIKLVLRRPFAKLFDYFDGVERLLQTTAPSEVANSGSYNRSALKKVMKEFSSKDVKRNVDSLYKRIDKHFSETSSSTPGEEGGSIIPGSTFVGVWKACEEELLKNTSRFSSLISQCYPDSGVGLDYTSQDVEAAFKKHRV